MIALVWISSILISCPPVFGWSDKNREPNTCTLNLLLSYRIYSSVGSFYLPCFIMVFVYLRIFKVIHDREKYLMKSSSSSTTTFSMPNNVLLGQKQNAISGSYLNDSSNGANDKWILCFRWRRRRQRRPQTTSSSTTIKRTEINPNKVPPKPTNLSDYSLSSLLCNTKQRTKTGTAATTSTATTGDLSRKNAIEVKEIISMVKMAETADNENKKNNNK